MYTPNPIDTSAVDLSTEILALAELLAKNTHDVYVQGRMAEGWRQSGVAPPQRSQRGSIRESRWAGTIPAGLYLGWPQRLDQ